jgi:hypothetical protein
MRLIGHVMLLVASTQMVQAENFSCRIGTRAACLDYGDKVCSSSAKCVDQNAACFDSYQCDYEGFTCKSNVTECFEKHDDLVQKYNTLLGKQRDLVSEYNDLLDTTQEIEGKLTNFKDCLNYADDLDEAKQCGL